MRLTLCAALAAFALVLAPAASAQLFPHPAFPQHTGPHVRISLGPVLAYSPLENERTMGGVAFNMASTTAGRMYGLHASGAFATTPLNCPPECGQEVSGIMDASVYGGVTHSRRWADLSLTLGPSITLVAKEELIPAPGLASRLGADLYPLPGLGLGVHVRGVLNKPFPYIEAGASLRIRTSSFRRR